MESIKSDDKQQQQQQAKQQQATTAGEVNANVNHKNIPPALPQVIQSSSSCSYQKKIKKYENLKYIYKSLIQHHLSIHATYLSDQAIDFITQLLHTDAIKRLGYKYGAKELRSHAFFNNFQWKKYRTHSLSAPFLPLLNQVNAYHKHLVPQSLNKVLANTTSPNLKQKISQYNSKLSLFSYKDSNALYNELNEHILRKDL